MKTLTITLIICFLAPLFAFSPPKTATVKWGPELEGKKRGTITGTLGFDETGYYISSYSVKGIANVEGSIQKLNTKLQMVSEFVFEEKDPVTKIKYESAGATFFNNRLLTFKTTTIKSSKTRELYIEEINKSTMKSTGKLVKIAELNYEKSRNKGGFSFYTTNREVEGADSKMMISIFHPSEKDENERFTLIVCDSELNKVWQKEIEIPYESGLFFHQSLRVDKHGNAYLLGKLFNEKVKSVKRGKQNYSYHLLAYTDNGENKVDYEIKLKDQFICDITFDIADNGDILAGGFYSKKGTQTVDGAYYMALDAKSKEVKNTSIKEFDIDFITQGMTEKQEAKARKKDEKGKDLELYEYDLDNLIRRDDGGVVLVGEQYYVVVSTYTSGNRTYTTYTYHYNNIIIINIDNAGKIEWAQTIPKRQVSQNDQGFYSSYAMMVDKDKLHFIFNDARENLTPKKQGEVKNFSFRDKNGIVSLATVDRDGKITREALINDADIEVGIRPKVCEQISDNTMLLFGEKKKKDQFATVTFGE